MCDFRYPACAHPSSSGDLNESPDIASKKIEVVVDQLDARERFRPPRSRPGAAISHFLTLSPANFP